MTIEFGPQLVETIRFVVVAWGVATILYAIFR